MCLSTQLRAAWWLSQVQEPSTPGRASASCLEVKARKLPCSVQNSLSGGLPHLLPRSPTLKGVVYIVLVYFLPGTVDSLEHPKGLIPVCILTNYLSW